jgi:transposase-like protein
MSSPLRQRRTHSKTFKAMLIAQCQEPGASIAAVAMAHQINDNMLRTWIRKAALAGEMATADKSIAIPSRIIPLQLAAVESTQFIRIHLQQGKTHIHMEWPMANAAQCSEWLQGWLR